MRATSRPGTSPPIASLPWLRLVATLVVLPACGGSDSGANEANRDIRIMAMDSVNPNASPAAEPPTETCLAFCAAQKLTCNDAAFTDGNGHTGGRRNDYSCQTCYAGFDLFRCDGTLVASTKNNKSGPYTGSQCGCSP